MALTTHKLSSAEISARNMKRLGDSTTGTSDYIQGLVDELPEYIAAKHNALVDELVTELNGKLTATDTDDITDTADNRFVSDTEKSTWNGKEDASNKKTTLDDNSDTFYPSQKAVKTAVDAKLSPNGSANDLTFTDTNSHYTTDEVGEALVQAGAEIDALESLVRPTYSRAVVIESDFYDGTSSAVPGMTGAAISSGSVTYSSTNANHPGTITLLDSTTANGGYRYMTSGIFLLNGGEKATLVFQKRVNRATDKVRFGFHDSTAIQTDPTDGAWLEMVGNSIVGKTANAGTISTTATSGTLTISNTAWYRCTVEVNAAATLVTFTLYNENGTVAWTDTLNANIPTTRETQFGVIAGETTTDAAGALILLDYMSMVIDRVLVR